MVGVGEDDFRIQIARQVALRNAFDGGLRADRHEHRRLDNSVAGVEQAGARPRDRAFGLDFDLDIAKEQSRENPVYYVQYAHARLASVFREAEARNITVPKSDAVDLSLLDLEEERSIIKLLAKYPEVVEEASLAYEPHRLTFYLQDLAGLLHNYYFKYRIISEDSARTGVKLFFMKQVKTVIRSALKILGVNAPERM